MGFVNSKRYDGVQLYHKANKDISYYIRYKDEDDKLKRVKIGDKSKGITEPFCNQKRNEIINSIKFGTESPIKSKKKIGILFDVVAQRYLEDLKLHSNKNTIRDRRSKYVKHLLEPFGMMEIDKITSTDLENLQKIKVKKLALKTVNQIIEMFSTIFTYGIRKDLSKSINPATKVRRFKVDNTRERFLDREEIELLYENIEDNSLLTLFVKLALATGGRLETVLSIQKKMLILLPFLLCFMILKIKTLIEVF